MKVIAQLVDTLYGPARIEAGTEMRVSFGSKGSQRARVVGFTRNGDVLAQKYRRRSDSWTKPVKIDCLDIIRVFEA